MAAEPLRVHHLSREAPLHTVAEMVRGQRLVGLTTGIGREPLAEGAAPCDADVVHLHWPEELVGWGRPVTAESIAAALRAVDRAAGGAKVVMTVHNLVPHHPTPLGTDLYRAFLERADGLVHLGERSIRLTAEAFPGVASKPQVVVPHPNYDGLRTLLEPEELPGGPRPGGDPVVMSFGAIRSAAEEAFLRDVRRRLKTRGARAVLHVRTLEGRLKPLRRLRRRLLSLGCGPIEYRDGFVPDEQVLATFAEAHAVLLGRRGQLNSAVVPLAFTLSRRIAGPDEMVIGELLRAGDNAPYPPGDPAAAAEAVDRLLALPDPDSPVNRALADEWSVERNGAAHAAFYAALLGREWTPSPAGAPTAASA
ncbi:hypothetical protein [Alienimonas sp. DA493]|uniref:hypothetical protein n=1 Tax=Alienimonas sp. DA493 TaxID=3373605 RepID=UPI0037548F0F